MAATANDLTRQQLDELDTLLQRMLSMPLNKAAPVVPTADLAAPPAGWRADPPARPAMPHVLAPPVLASSPIPPAGPAPVSFAPSPLPELENYQPPPVELTPAVLVSPQIRPGVLPAPQPGPSLSALWWPLCAINWILESILKLFGPPGELLTRPAAKGLLGASGLAMLVAAGLWAAQGQGWIRFPVEEFLNH